MSEPYDQSGRRFRRGIALAWIPSIPFVAAIVHSFHMFPGQKATGLGAIAYGLTEVYLPIVILLTLALEVAAIVLLVRSFSKSQMGRTLVSALSIGWSMLIIGIFSLLIWSFYVELQHTRVPH